MLYGDLGVIKNNQKVIKVENRPGFVYVRLRSVRSELIEAFNDKVEEKYNVPVVLTRQGRRYVVVERNRERYQDWDSENPFIPLHAKTHQFDKDGGVIGTDGVFISNYQFLPNLLCPFPGTTSQNVFIYPNIDYYNNSWVYYGKTGTQSLIPYRPRSGSSFVLVSINYETGNPHYLATTGSYIPSSATGISQILPYIPTPPTGSIIPIGVVRLAPDTQYITWKNIYDVRKHFGSQTTNASSSANTYITTGSFGNITFDIEGMLETGTSMSQPYLITDTSTFSSVYLLAEYLGVSGTTIVDVKKNSSGNYISIFTGTPLSLPYNSTGSWVSLTPYIYEFVRGDILRIDVLQKAKEAKNIKVIASSGVGTVSEGVLVREVDNSPSVNARTLTFTNGSLTNLGGGEVGVSLIPDIPSTEATPTGSYTTTSSSYSDMGNAIEVSITKVDSSSSLLLQISGSLYSTSQPVRVVFGVQRSGTDTDVHSMDINASSTHTPFMAQKRISGLGTGTYTFRLRWKLTSGAGTLTFDTNDRAYLNIQEVKA